MSASSKWQAPNPPNFLGLVTTTAKRYPLFEYIKILVHDITEKSLVELSRSAAVKLPIALRWSFPDDDFFLFFFLAIGLHSENGRVLRALHCKGPPPGGGGGAGNEGFLSPPSAWDETGLGFSGFAR